MATQCRARSRGRQSRSPAWLAAPDQFEHEPGFLEYLDTQGLRPGITIRVLDEPHGDGLRVEVDGRQRTIRADCGQKVWVRA